MMHLLFYFALLLPMQGSVSTQRATLQIESHKITLSKRPVVGEKVTVFYEIIPKRILERSDGDFNVVFYGFRGVRPTRPDTVFRYNAKQGHLSRFSIEVEFVSSPAVLAVRIPMSYPGLSVKYYLLSAETGQYASAMEIQNNPPVDYRFNPDLRIFEQDVLNFKENRWYRNRAIIDTIRTISPEISDSLALVLYSDIRKVVYPPGIAKWQDQAKYLLEQGWLDYSDPSVRAEFLNQLRAVNERRNEKSRKRWEQERLKFQQARRLRDLLSWLIPVTILVLMLVVLLIIRRRMSSKVVTSHRFDRIITYLVYLLAIGIALYFAWPYLGLTGK